MCMYWTVYTDMWLTDTSVADNTYIISSAYTCMCVSWGIMRLIAMLTPVQFCQEVYFWNVSISKCIVNLARTRHHERAVWLNSLCEISHRVAAIYLCVSFVVNYHNWPQGHLLRATRRQFSRYFYENNWYSEFRVGSSRPFDEFRSRWWKCHIYIFYFTCMFTIMHIIFLVVVKIIWVSFMYLSPLDVHILCVRSTYQLLLNVIVSFIW